MDSYNHNVRVVASNVHTSIRDESRIAEFKEGGIELEIPDSAGLFQSVKCAVEAADSGGAIVIKF
jgi:hypothetical protein